MHPTRTSIAYAAVLLTLSVPCLDAAAAQCRFNGIRGYTDDGRPSPNKSCLPLYRFEAVSSSDGRTIIFDSEGRRYTAQLGGGKYYYIESTDVVPATKNDFAAVFQIDKEGMMASGYCGDGFIVLAVDKCE